MHICVSVCVWVCTHKCMYLQRPEKAVIFSGTRVTSGYESLIKNTINQTWVLCKSHLSTPSPTHSFLYAGGRDLNTGPHAYMLSTLNVDYSKRIRKNFPLKKKVISLSIPESRKELQVSFIPNPDS